jgi:hypothetical protein
MVGRKEWMGDSRQRTHDKHMRATNASARAAGVSANAIHGNIDKIHSSAQKVANAVLPGKKLTGKGGATVRDVLKTLDGMGKKIVSAGPQQLSPAQINQHHSNVRAMIRLFKQNSAHAKKMSKSFDEIAISFESILKMNKK